MKTIIRIEHSCGNGIWKALYSRFDNICYSFSFYNNFKEKHASFPTPYFDKGINRMMEIDEYCAFKSIEQLQQWIEKEWWIEIFKAGFKVFMLDVTSYVEGEYQILYKKKNILQSKDISSLFK